MGRVILLEGAGGDWSFIMSEQQARRPCWQGTTAAVAVRRPLGG